ncbi:MAG: PorP/SprF family type IX secretion system membrane protein [Bacteroidota bacterium]|nr:PorP/SprF family type IX secretion system membrane protein [Bacteroidota bacterium]
MQTLLDTQKIKAVAVVLFAFYLSGDPAIAQDPVFSQAYLSPIYLNPAATGAGEHDLRISAIYRRQWWTIPSQMNYTAVSIDKFFPKISSGLGLLATNSSEGYLRKAGVYGSYSYTVCSGTASVAENGGLPKWFWTGAVQFGVAQRRIDYSKLVFADELDVNGIIPGAISAADPPLNSGKLYPDFAAGTFFSYHFTENSRLLTGFSAHHINKPDESLTNTSDTVRSQLPVLWSGNLLYTYTNPERIWSFSIAAIGYRQATHSSYQIGTEVTQNQFNISLGLWYRGTVNFRDMNTISLTLSFNLNGRDNDRDRVRVGIAQDAQVGRNSYSYTAGSSEIGFVWDHSSYNQDAEDPCKPKISSQNACPIR